MTFTQIDYHITHSDQLSRVGYIKLKNGKKIETLINWIGLSVAESSDFQFNAFKEAGVTSFLSNVYDLKYQDKKGIRNDLLNRLVDEGLNHKLDSGGFQLMKQQITGKKKFDLNPENVYEIQRSVPCDIGIILDVPIGTESREDKVIKKIDKTLLNLESLLKIYDNEEDSFTILPVIHGHDIKKLNYAFNKLQDKIGEIPTALGIGSLVPMVKTMRNSSSTGGKKNFVKILMYLRNRLPKTFIHAFGIGGTMAYLAYLCGVDSIDSNGWILKASRGVIQLPGTSDRFLRKKSHNRPYLLTNRKIRGTKKIINEIDLFMKCKCPICIDYCTDGIWSQHDWVRKQDEFDQYTVESRMKRVVHNLWLYQTELNHIKQAIKNKKSIDFIGKRLQNSMYKGLFQDVIKLSNNQTNLTDFYL